MSTDNFDAFSIDLAELAEKLPAEQIVAVHKKIHLEGLSRIVARTPVDKGVTRANWQSTLGSPATGTREAFDPDSVKKQGITPAEVQTAVIGDARSVIENIPPYSRSFITNNLEHILVLEEGGFVPKNPGPSKDPREGRAGEVLVVDGYSKQAPQGMVAITFAELEPKPLDDFK